MNFDITDIIECVIALVSAVVSAFLIPYLKTQLSENKQARLIFWVRTAVKAAEQLFGSKTGQQKKEYVVAFLFHLSLFHLSDKREGCILYIFVQRRFLLCCFIKNGYS